MADDPRAKPRGVTINRAPVLTLWAAVVAERLGYDRDEALSLGRALSGLNAQSKGRRLGIFRPREAAGAAPKKREAPRAEPSPVLLMGRSIPAVRTPDGLRAATGGREISPESAKRYLEGKFGEDLARVREAMKGLAGSMPPRELEAEAYALYEAFRPSVPAGAKGWGSKGTLDLARIRDLAAPRRPKR